MGMRKEGIQRFNELAIKIKNVRKSNSQRSKCEENYRKKYSNNDFVKFNESSNDGDMFKQAQPKRTKIIVYTDLQSHYDQQHDENEHRKMNEFKANSIINVTKKQESKGPRNNSTYYITAQIPPMQEMSQLIRMM